VLGDMVLCVIGRWRGGVFEGMRWREAEGGRVGYRLGGWGGLDEKS